MNFLTNPELGNSLAAHDYHLTEILSLLAAGAHCMQRAIEERKAAREHIRLLGEVAAANDAASNPPFDINEILRQQIFKPNEGETS